MKTLLTIAALSALVLVTGCDRPREASAGNTAPAPIAPPTAHVTTPPPAPPAPPIPSDLHGFAPDQVLAVRFTEINDKGYPMVMMKNLTGRDIDCIRGGFRVTDADGTILHMAGLTIAVPNDLFVAADSEVENSPFGLNRKPEVMQRLKDAPEEISFSFETQHVEFMQE